MTYPCAFVRNIKGVANKIKRESSDNVTQNAIFRR